MLGKSWYVRPERKSSVGTTEPHTLSVGTTEPHISSVGTTEPQSSRSGSEVLAELGEVEQADHVISFGVQTLLESVVPG